MLQLHKNANVYSRPPTPENGGPTTYKTANPRTRDPRLYEVGGRDSLLFVCSCAGAAVACGWCQSNVWRSCPLLSNEPQWAAGRGGWGELGLVSTVCISLRGYNAHCTLRLYWFDYVTSWQWLQGLNFYYSPWNEKCSSGNTFIDRAFIFRSEREKSN